MLPGYMNGYRMAIQDNWNDLNQYNQVQSGQLQNLWTEAAMRPSYMQLLAETAMKQLGALNSAGEYRVNQPQWFGRTMRGAMLGAAAPEMTGLQIEGAMSDQQRKLFDNSQYYDISNIYRSSLLDEATRARNNPYAGMGTSMGAAFGAEGFDPFKAKPFAPGGIFDAEAVAREKAQVPTAARS